MQIFGYDRKKEKASEVFSYLVILYYQPLPLFVLPAPNFMHFFDATVKQFLFHLVSWKQINPLILIHRENYLFFKKKKKGCFQRNPHTINLFSGFYSWMRNNSSVCCCCFSFGPQKFFKITLNLHCHCSLVNLAILIYFWLYDR